MNTQNTLFSHIRTLPLFAGVPEDTLSTLNYETVNVAAGEPLTDWQGALWVLARGVAEIFTENTENPVLLKTLFEGALFGAASLFYKGEDSLSRIVAKTPCLFFKIGQVDVCRLLKRDTVFLENYLSLLCERVAFLNRKIRCFTAGSATLRLSLWLLEAENEVLTLPTSLSALADTLGMGRASLYRALFDLEKAGLIEKHGRTIRIIHREGLLGYAQKEKT